MTIITLEEHFLSQVAHSAAETKPDPVNEMMRATNPAIFERFLDLSDLRISDMDAGQVTLQVISHGPVSLSVSQCREANDQLAAAVRTHPGRFAGFADLPMHDPVEAAKELRRMCDGHAGGVKFLGALVDSHTDTGIYYDGPDYDVLWAEAVKLDVPIYLHPNIPSDGVYSGYLKSPHLSEKANLSIQAFGFGWHSDVAMHVLRLFAAGVFDRFPKLKIVIGHMGEMIPYMLQRIERVSAMWGTQRRFREVWDENIWVTTSGNWSLDPIACMLRNTKPDRILYSVDYPFGNHADGLKWLDELAGSGMVSEEQLEGIRWRNAAKLLKLDLA